MANIAAWGVLEFRGQFTYFGLELRMAPSEWPPLRVSYIVLSQNSVHPHYSPVVCRMDRGSGVEIPDDLTPSQTRNRGRKKELRNIRSIQGRSMM
jgi:hypothetical protein